MRTCIAAMLATALLFSAGRAADEKPAVKVVGLEVSARLPDNQMALNFSYRPGTTVGVMIHLPGKRIAEVDVAGSKLETYVDDKKTSLEKPEKPKPGDFLDPWLDPFPRYNQNRDMCTVLLRGNVAPFEGATKIHVKASIAFLIGADSKTDEHKDVALKAGDKIKLGDMRLEIPKEQFGQGIAFTLYSDKPNFEKIVFLDAAGKEIKVNFGGSSKVGFEKVEYQTYLSSEKKLDKATIKLSYFNKLEKLSVPVDVQVGVGF